MIVLVRRHTPSSPYISNRPCLQASGIGKILVHSSNFKVLEDPKGKMLAITSCFSVDEHLLTQEIFRLVGRHDSGCVLFHWN